MITTKKHRTVPFGKRPLPNPDIRQLDHPLVKKFGIKNIRQMELDAGENSRAFLLRVMNPSLNALERFVVTMLKETPVFQFDDEERTNLRWASELPPSVQKVINSHWNDRPRQPLAFRVGPIIATSL